MHMGYMWGFTHGYHHNKHLFSVSWEGEVREGKERGGGGKGRRKGRGEEGESEVREG